MTNNSIFISGTNTDIGKTLVSAMIMSAAQSQKINLHYFKPIQTGTDLDEETVKKLADLPDEKTIKPIFSFQLPAAPYRAALAESKKIDINLIAHHFKKYAPLSCVVEGAGGLLVPLTEKLLVRDLIKRLNLPLLIVASTQLGTINHTLLTIEAALAKKISIKGIILSGTPDTGLSDTLRQFTDVPILAEIPWLEKISPENLKKISPTIFDKKLLKEIFQ
jgi:dethiobiotin synthetase